MSAETPERWRGQALARPVRDKAWTAAARFDAVPTTAVMDENAKGAWCHANGVFLMDLDARRQSPRRGWRARGRPREPERARIAARQRKKEKFTALLHHVFVDLLRDAFLALPG